MSVPALPSDREVGPCAIVRICPICTGRMEIVYEGPAQKVCVCQDCHSSVSVPTAAWAVARQKGL
jgi:hypothetical protein